MSQHSAYTHYHSNKVALAVVGIVAVIFWVVAIL